MKETFYFSHDYNCREDQKIMKLVRVLKMGGYGLYWAIIEMLAMNGGKLKISSIDDISYSLHTDNNVITSLLQDFGLFIYDEENDEFYSKRLLDHFEKRKDDKIKKSEAGKIGMAKRWGNDNTVITEHNKVKESKGKESKIKEIKVNNNEVGIVATKVATLQSIIKDNFSLEFITEVYNKYNMSKSEFKEECELFEGYWNAILLKGKDKGKPRWEGEKTFDSKLRFRTWIKNNDKWSKRVIVNSEDEERKQKLAELKKKKDLLFNN